METKTSKLKSLWKKIRNFSLFILTVVLFVCIRYYYPYVEGVKTGQLNFVVYKGIIFKTYEGKLIQSGIWSNKPGGIQSNEFEFSIEDKTVAEELMRAGGRTVELHYKEYFAAIPWRGYSRYVVDEIIRIGEQPSEDLSGILPESQN